MQCVKYPGATSQVEKLAKSFIIREAIAFVAGLEEQPLVTSVHCCEICSTAPSSPHCSRCNPSSQCHPARMLSEPRPRGAAWARRRSGW